MSFGLFPLTLNDRCAVEQALSYTSSIRDSPLAMLAFAPHMVWKELLAYSWTKRGGWLTVFAEYTDGVFMPLPPLGPVSSGTATQKTLSCEKILEEAFAFMDTRNNRSAVTRIENIPEDLKPEFERLGYCVKEKDPDYLYHTKDLIGLKGDPYKSQRGAYNQFVRLYDPLYQPYTLAEREGCLALFDRWIEQQRQIGQADQSSSQWISQAMLEDARGVHEEVLAHHDALGLLGRVVKLGDRVCGYTFGYPRNQHVFCVLIEVTDRHLSGIAQYTFRELCRECSNYAFMNTMDDSGLSRLARAKRSYRPCRLVPNYIATRGA